MTNKSDFRWCATVHYKTDSGLVDVTHDLEEIDDLHDLVERGPHFDTIEKIEIIRVNHLDGVNLTIEKASQL